MNTQQNPYNTPTTTNTMAEGPAYVKPTLKQSLFSFQGRFSIAQFWINVLIGIGISIALVIVISVVGAILPDLSLILAIILGLPTYVILAWISLAASVKRWHDRNKSGWWVCIGFIPLIGPFWAFIETGFLPGTTGPNQFGPSPL